MAFDWINNDDEQMPGGLGRMSSRIGPVTMIIPLSFVMYGRRVFIS